MKKQILIVGIIVLFICVGFSGCFKEESKNPTSINNNQNEYSSKPETLYVDINGGENYTSIQDAINASTDNDTVFVYSGEYNEYVDVNKSIKLIGENKNTTIINVSGNLQYDVKISSENVTVEGFSIKYNEINPEYYPDMSGIYIISENCTISDNIIFENKYGIYIKSGKNNSIIGNDIFQNEGGIYVCAEKNIITNNSIYLNSKTGIMFISSSNNYVANNNIENNGLDGLNIYSGDNFEIIGNIITNNSGKGIDFSNGKNNNTISRNSIINNDYGITIYSYSKNIGIDNNTISSNKNSGITIAEYSTNNRVCDNNIVSNKNKSIRIEGDSNYNLLMNNYINDSDIGIYFWYSSDNIITKNELTESSNYAIELESYSDNNNIHHNNFKYNSIGTKDECNNNWDDGAEGNYWSDYSEKYPNAIGSNGIWSTPYNIPGGNNKDMYPLMNPVDI